MRFSDTIHRVRVFLKMLPVLIRRMTRLERTLSILLVAIVLASTVQLIYRSITGALQQNKGIYAEGLVGSPRLLNPLFSDFNDVDRDINALIFSGLMKYDPATAQFVPDIAEKVERSPDNLTYTATLREGIKWHDDVLFSVDDVLFTYRDLIQDPGLKNNFLRTAFDDVRIEKIDDLHISFTLSKPNSYFISYLITGILPKHLLNETPVKELEKSSFNRKPVGTGPYQYPEGAGRLPKNASSLTLTAYEDYYDEKPQIPTIRFSFFENQEDLIDEKNTASGIPKLVGGNLEDMQEDDRFELHTYKLPQYAAVFFNLDRPFMKEKRFRQGLLISVDKNALAQELGGVEVIDSILRNRLPDEWMHKYTPEGLTKILGEFGYTKKGSAGFYMDSKGQTLSLVLVSKKFPDESPQEIMTLKTIDFLKKSWEILGIRIDVTRETDENFQTLVRKREYDLLLAGHSLGYNTDAFSFWHSSQAGEFGLNLSQLKTFRVDSALEDLRLTFDIDRKKRKLKDLEKIISDETPALFLYTPKYTFALDKRIQGFTFENYAFPADRFSNMVLTFLASS